MRLAGTLPNLLGSGWLSLIKKFANGTDFSSKSLLINNLGPIANQLYGGYGRVILHCACHSTPDQFYPASLPLNAIPCVESGSCAMPQTYARPARQTCGPTDMILKNIVMCK